MKFYLFSFIIHMILFFSVIKLPKNEVKLDSKNVVVYLNELKIKGENTPEPAPIKNVEPPKEKIEKKIEKKEIKKIKKKIEKKKIVKKVKEEVESKVEEKITEGVEIAGVNKNINELDGLVKDGTGTYIGDQKSSQGIGYKIKREVDPNYPMMAKKIGFKDEVVIKTKFLVGLNGKVEEIIFLNDYTKYGFQKEVEKALKKWEFEPIV
ncbi:energy transducer TonB, partial [Fusobacterium sp.]|uniref:energy transducer TonB n=1 Tax=Fusobacterium sp. TaxID=68766 RepID=UPI0025C135E0